MKLRDILGTLPSGQVATLGADEFRKLCRDQYIMHEGERKRREIARKRLAYYYDDGSRYLSEVVEKIFKNQRVREWRRELIPFANYQNLTRRIVREISTVYAEPAIRRIKGKAANEGYKDFQRAIMLDNRMRRCNRMLNLLNEVLLQFRFRASGAPVVDVITPDHFWAIAHPSDPTEFVGAIIEQVPSGDHVNPQQPHYLVLAAEENYSLDKNFHVVAKHEHGWPFVPAILAHREAREDRLLDSTSGNDLVSAHENIALLNILMLKSQKAGTKLAYATGDTSRMARDQPMDDESLLEAPEGVSFSTLDLGTDPNSYILAARAVIKQIAANYGIAESTFDLSYQATSGFEIELKRVGLREMRREQIADYRPLERSLAQLQSDILTRSGSPMAFTTNGWAIAFGEVDTPTEPMSKLLWFEKLERMGLANRIEFYLWMNPEATQREAEAAVEGNLDLRIELMRKFQSENPGIMSPGDGNQPQPRDSDKDDGEDS